MNCAWRRHATDGAPSSGPLHRLDGAIAHASYLAHNNETADEDGVEVPIE